jgi:hypothetical protein
MQYAVEALEQFNEIWSKMTFEQKLLYGGKPITLAEYENCDCCGASNKKARIANKEDLTRLGPGHTMGPMVVLEAHRRASSS